MQGRFPLPFTAAAVGMRAHYSTRSKIQICPVYPAPDKPNLILELTSSSTLSELYSINRLAWRHSGNTRQGEKKKKREKSVFVKTGTRHVYIVSRFVSFAAASVIYGVLVDRSPDNFDNDIRYTPPMPFAPFSISERSTKTFSWRSFAADPVVRFV